MQLVAPVEDQVSIVEPPAATEVGLAEMVATGAATEPTVMVLDAESVPPGPVQVSV